jgi:hypothetical protein
VRKAALVVLVLFAVIGSVSAQEQTPAPAGRVVTLKGVLTWEATCIPNPAKKDYDEKQLVFFAVEGTPEVKAEVDGIMKEFYTGDGLDCDQARTVNEQWIKRLKYYVTPGDVAAKYEKECRWGNPRSAVTGVISEKDGRKWITPGEIRIPVPIAYPPKMLAPDKPLVKAGDRTLTLKVTDALSLKCILLPAGRFLQGSPFYQWRYQDEYPHEVTLTRPFYMAEIPVTQEMFEAVIGKNPSKSKGPQFPVEHATWADIKEFCRILSEKNGRAVRVPTDAELEYAARVGTSSPCLPEKYKDQVSLAGTREAQPAPVKTMKPNAWGLYDILCGGWHIAGDYKADNVRVTQVDPKGPARGADGNMHRSHGGWHYDHMRPNMHGAIGEKGNIYEGGAPIFRVVVDAEPPTPAPAGTAEKEGGR